ncbi:MAG: polyprenol monophosphomannose synthase [Nocardioidaceae bacterium]|nr:polyprenol monophosphomannose synthase [Nocardioidaceae bacterium]
MPKPVDQAPPHAMEDVVAQLGRTLMVVPTYNEATNLAWIIDRLRFFQPALEVLVVDDGSPDGTGAIADRLAAADAHVHVLHRSAKGGLGAAYLAGFAWALERGYDVVGEMDADGSHQPEQLQRLLSGLLDADLVIGSRWVPGGSVVNWPWTREALSRGGNLYVRLLLGIGVRDATAGFRLYRRATLEKIRLEDVRSTGYVFQTDLVTRVLRAGLTVREVPIEFVERVRGESKMSGQVAVESLRRISSWGAAERWAQLKTVLRRRRSARGAPARPAV